jgi:hypothetical protein
VNVGIVDGFVRVLKKQAEIPVTSTNLRYFSPLAYEFHLRDLERECDVVSRTMVSKLEERIYAAEKELAFSRMVVAVTTGLWLSIVVAAAFCQVVGPGLRGGIDFSMDFFGSVNGIVAYLTQRHGGNIHHSRIVTITASSVYRDDPNFRPKHVADLGSDTRFTSQDIAGQWLRWDFREMRVRVSHYTIRTCSLKNWVIETSMDGQKWTEIDRHFEGNHFGGSQWKVATFTTGKSVECRFIRLTQPNHNHNNDNSLNISAVEFFGRLLE